MNNRRMTGRAFPALAAAVAMAMRWGGKIPEHAAEEKTKPEPAYHPTLRNFGDFYRVHAHGASGPGRSETTAYFGSLARVIPVGSHGRDRARAEMLSKRVHRRNRRKHSQIGL